MALSREEIQSGLIIVLQSQGVEFDPSTITDETSFLDKEEDGGLELDSLDLVETVMLLEECFTDDDGRMIKIDDKVTQQMVNVGAVLDFLEGKQLPGEDVPKIDPVAKFTPPEPKAPRA